MSRIPKAYNPKLDLSRLRQLRIGEYIEVVDTEDLQSTEHSLRNRISRINGALNWSGYRFTVRKIVDDLDVFYRITRVHSET